MIPAGTTNDGDQRQRLSVLDADFDGQDDRIATTATLGERSARLQRRSVRRVRTRCRRIPLPSSIAVTCARVAKAIFGQQAGAAMVVMVNNATSLPPFEGAITAIPTTAFHSTSRFRSSAWRGCRLRRRLIGFKLRARERPECDDLAGVHRQPELRRLRDFSSGGPRTGDSALKPDISAPGVSIFSTALRHR